jgi:hypothetical protein
MHKYINENNHGENRGRNRGGRDGVDGNGTRMGHESSVHQCDILDPYTRYNPELFLGTGELAEECVGRLDDLSSIANVPFRVSTILVAIAVIIALVSICAMLLFLFCQSTTVFYICGWMQVISGECCSSLFWRSFLFER